MSSCDICGNAGVLEKDGKLYECVCAELRRIAASMPVYIRSAPVCEGHIKEFLPDKKTHIIDAINKSLYLSAYQDDMRAFVKLMMIKHSNKFIRFTSDREIRDVYVGSTSQKARGEYSKEPVYNNLEDLVKSPDLLLVRLNELKAKNKAAPGALEEAMCYRLDRNMPMWMISDRKDPFCDRSYAYSDTVAALLRSLVNCQIDPIIKSNNDFQSPLALEMAPSVYNADKSDSSVSHSKRKSKTNPSIDNDEVERLGGLSAFGSGLNTKKKY